MKWSEQFNLTVSSSDEFMSRVTGLSYEVNINATPNFAYFSLISAGGDGDLEGGCDQGERRIQLSIWADSPETAEDIAGLAIEPVMEELNCSAYFERSLGIDEDGLYGFAIDFLIYFENPRGD